MTAVGWIIGAVLVLALGFFWLHRKEQREIAAWDDSEDGWPNEENKSMD